MAVVHRWSLFKGHFSYKTSKWDLKIAGVIYRCFLTLVWGEGGMKAVLYHCINHFFNVILHSSQFDGIEGCLSVSVDN